MDVCMERKLLVHLQAMPFLSSEGTGVSQVLVIRAKGPQEVANQLHAMLLVSTLVSFSLKAEAKFVGVKCKVDTDDKPIISGVLREVDPE